MRIFDGSIQDKYNFKSDKFLEVNSCGVQRASDDHMVIRRDGREDYHILLITEGECRIFFLGEEKLVKSGYAAVYAPGEMQKYIFNCGTASLWCHFSGTAADEIVETCNIKSGIYDVSGSPDVSKNFFKMIQRFNISSKKKLANASLLELLYCISDCIEKKEPGINDERIMTIITYMNLNYPGKITLGELAAKIGYSSSRFSHLFTKVTGISPMNYLNKVRLENSLELLSGTQMNIESIAFACGFGDKGYYSKLFKKQYGISPSRYRECHKPDGDREESVLNAVQGKYLQ